MKLILALLCICGAYFGFKVIAYMQRETRGVEEKENNNIIKFTALLLTIAAYVLVTFMADKHFFHFRDIACYRIGMVCHCGILTSAFVMSLELCKKAVNYLYVPRVGKYLRE